MTNRTKHCEALVPALVLAGIMGSASSVPAVPQTVDYTYDAIGRLTSATYDGNWLVEYEYDAGGNIMSISSGPTGATGVESETTAPRRFALGNAVPNPFNGFTQVAYQLPVGSPVRLAVFDVTGRRVHVLLTDERPAGFYSCDWDGRTEGGRRVASGTYVLRMEAGPFSATRKIVIID
jgi:YD repeat-containing protein